MQNLTSTSTFQNCSICAFAVAPYYTMLRWAPEGVHLPSIAGTSRPFYGGMYPSHQFSSHDISFFAHASILTFLQVCRLSRRRASQDPDLSPAPESSPGSSTMDCTVTALLSRKANRFPSGVLIAADTLGSYGTLARFKDVNRVGAYGSHTIVGAAGDLSDFQVCSQLSAFAPCFSHHIILGHQGST